MSETPLSSSPNDIIDLVDMENVQGDIIIGLPKRKQDFVFFVIEKAKHFKSTVSDLNITTTGDVQRAREKIRLAKQEEADCLIPLPGLNIAFTQKGLHALGIKDDLSDVPFSHGQFMDAKTLGDEGVETDKGFQPNWESAFTERIDGVLLVTGETSKTVKETLKTALNVLGSSIRVVHTVKGSSRPKELKGREHFGWEDGVSNPAVKHVGDEPLPGQQVIPAGTILLGKDKDPVEGRPAWATEGSFMVFRQLSQLVPEFHDFLHRNPIIHPGLSREEGSELLGARLVGRWKSGAPVELAPLHDDPILGKDKKRNNNFVFSQEKLEAGQSKCPFSAHIRKMNPRNDLDDDSVSKLSITRSGIAYGPEVMPSENEEKCTEYDRGLAFVCYQSSLQVGPVSRLETDRGFRFIQRFWANNTEFPPEKGFSPGKGPGIDPIIGQINGASRGTLGTNRGPQLTLPRDFVSSRGGEYFFSPSIRALKTVFSGIPVPDVSTTVAQPTSTEPDPISHGYP